MSHRYIFIGAGAIGGGIGGLLNAHKIPAVLVARGEHLTHMRQHGLQLRMPDDIVHSSVVTAASPDDIELTTNDVLVLAVKTQDAEKALTQWADAPVGNQTAGEVLPILTALNGVHAETLALRWFQRVYGVCVWMPAIYLKPGEIILRGSPIRGVLHMSRVPARLTDANDSALLRSIAADWQRAGLHVVLPTDVMPWKYRKLISNLANSVQALLGSADTDIVAAAATEAERIYAATGIVMTSNEEEETYRPLLQVAPVPGEPEGLGGSTWQSITRGTRRTEVDYLNGEITSIAHAAGLTAPVNATLARLTREAANNKTRPGALSVEQLKELLPDPLSATH